MLSGLYEYWRSLPREGRLPRRADFDPLDIPKLLSKLFMIDVAGTAPDFSFRYRLAGTEIGETYGLEITGMTPAEAFPDRAEKLIAGYALVAASGEPDYQAYPSPVPNRQFLTVERLICPFASDGETVDILIGALVFGGS